MIYYDVGGKRSLLLTRKFYPDGSKKAEQAEKRAAIKEGRQHGTHTEGIDPRAGGNEGLRDA